MRKQHDLLENAVIVAAHPDDEILWFSSIMQQARQVIILYRDFWAVPDLGNKRAAAIANLPHDNVTWLELAEAGSYGCADWTSPEMSETGLAFTATATMRDIKSMVKKMVPADSPAPAARLAQAYNDNFFTIVERLRPMLSEDMNVFTHNPWGEYGHEDHVQCFRAVDRLRQEIGFKLWMSNYCTERSLPLAMTYFQRTPGPFIRLPADVEYAQRVAQAYVDADCWTWIDDWDWFEDECFMEAPAGPSSAPGQGRLFPLNFFSM
ncbi:hypothetical protein PZ897_18710 [Hoeflea sp. YIM 152468]|uniref:hypothetical protein n=1 Tax=Hoeflea sp. YIM 152468 TaxID=3031759 RepID=UPI0023DBDB6D|nr:hypothetical protein [Hoeflea sp. YIM 152468]MDF1610218.1 hypothetical protein [Hoeflea sp. YIM 152468]